MTNQFSSELPPKIYAEAVVRSASGESLLRSSQPVTSENVTLFHASSDQRQLAADRLRAVGFEVLDIGKTSINIAAPPEVYERSLGANLEQVERPVMKGFGQPYMSSFINSVDQTPFGEIDISDTRWNNILDGVAINEPAYYLQKIIPNAAPPQTNTRYLQVPHDLAEELSAKLAHEQGITGKEVKVVVVDSGCYAEHPFFKQHKYRLDVVLGPGSTHPDQDVNGHGTGIAANVFAIAPDVDLTVVKADVALENKHRNINSTAAFRKAISLHPDIISCSWGSDLRSFSQLSSSHKVLAAAIAEAVRQGIVVIFAAGNGHWGFPSQHPDVIAVGGVYKHLEGSFKGRIEASNYASSFISTIYPGRRVPDVCGLVGRLPNAAYIMLPVPPGSETDHARSVMGDETEPIDGWAAFSGTSSAAPQLAGVCALMEQFVPKLAPATIKHILEETASDIIEGNSNPGTGGGQARDGPDLATGYGLAVASKAIQAAKNALDRQNPNSTTIFYQPSLSTMPTGNIPPDDTSTDDTDSQKNPINYLSQVKYQRRLNTMSLDESTLRKLRKEIDEIQIELNSHFKERFKELSNENIELVIDESNFVESTSESEAISSLRTTLREVVDQDTNEVKENSITKKHISAAESLLRRGKCQERAKNVLVKAMALKGKTVKYKVNLEDRPVEVSGRRDFKTCGNSIG
ncbi:MAG: S8 family serine peptidase [Cyanobacteria bacterium RM1_2_2]|nr:S8 family serine peptidase [Cyanobacteria bacterium RM1_2_2]